MATTASSRATPPVSRRTSTVAASSTAPLSSSISRGATARSAASPRVSSSLNAPAARRASPKGSASPPRTANGEARESRESLSTSLKQETEKKEQLLVQLQNKDQTITNITTENDNLTSALNAAETRLTELYADQGRMEEEMAARIEVAEKLRTQVRDLEKEKRDIQRRYNEQVPLTLGKTATFEAERQAFYDNEQHLKSRIQSLTQTRKLPIQPIPPSPSQTEVDDEDTPEPASQSAKQDVNDPEQEPAEMTALKLELSTLSTSYNSLQSTLVLLQTQLIDLKRVNNELQEENESYNILLREKTLNGQFDVLRMGGGSVSSASGSETGEDDESEVKDGESFRSRNTGRSVLDPVDELAEEQEPQLDPGLDPEFQQTQEQTEVRDLESRDADELSRSTRRHRRRASSSSHSPSSRRGESLANLPITGPGLDLAAELGRAENKDILEGRVTLESERLESATKGRKSRKGSEAGQKVSTAAGLSAMETSTSPNDLETLRNEVKSLRDANKALSLYASKIIDRIISQEGFEHVLAVDYDKQPSPVTAGPIVASFNVSKSPNPPVVQPPKKGRPQSVIFSSFSASSSPASSSGPLSPGPERLTTFDSISSPTPASSPQQKSVDPPTASASTRASRRSLSFDWKSFSMFGDKKPEPNANLRPLTLRPGSSPVVTGARKLDTYEDEEDRRERERLHATMKLMGIEKPVTPASPMQKSYSSPANPNSATTSDASSSRTSLTGISVTPGTVIAPGTVVSPGTAIPPATASRFSFFRRSSSLTASAETSPHSSIHGSPNPSASNGPGLTQEALEQAEAESSLAALDAHERNLSAEMSKGASGGFTEIVRRSGDRRSRKSGESGSTVWSAGMSKGEDGDD
ncbi:hypothetical protein B0H21DRAFT_781494 [Amylocystis lapponica]|nr:hypothetical protein B0H21DRAFT_781494 [Amylocystis lapponica]